MWYVLMAVIGAGLGWLVYEGYRAPAQDESSYLVPDVVPENIMRLPYDFNVQFENAQERHCPFDQEID